jgi:hypothetical protein
VFLLGIEGILGDYAFHTAKERKPADLFMACMKAGPKKEYTVEFEEDDFSVSLSWYKFTNEVDRETAKNALDTYVFQGENEGNIVLGDKKYDKLWIKHLAELG